MKSSSITKDLKSKIYILHTLVEKSRYLDDIPYSIWFIEEDVIKYTSIALDNFQFDELMMLDMPNKYNSLRLYIEDGRKEGTIREEDITNDILISAMDNEDGLKSDLIRSIREYKLNQIINQIIK